MSYIGRGTDAISNVEKLDNITFDGSATYALTKSSAAFTPVGANNILISIDGVIQQGNFSVSTTNIVFDWSPTSSNTCNFILHYGTGVLNVPADGSIVAAKMAANSVDSDAYVDGSIDAVHLSANSVDSDAYVDASIDNAHLADDAVGVAELSATGTASSSTFLRGDNSWASAGGDTQPYFHARQASVASISGSSDVAVVGTTEVVDTGSAYNTSNGRFTPQTSGYYYIYGCAYTYGDTSTCNFTRTKLFFNGSEMAMSNLHYNDNDGSGGSDLMSSIINFNGSSDYVQLYVHASYSSGTIYLNGASGIDYTYFGGFKLI